MKKLLVVLLLAQHHSGVSGTVTIPASGTIIVRFDPKFAPDKPIPACFLSPKGKAKARMTSREWVEIIGKAGDVISYSCTTERKP